MSTGADLNPGQRLVAEGFDRESFVSAGAGSGKTRALAERFAATLESLPDCNPIDAFEKVGAITFTEKAAAELSERIRQTLLGRHRGDLARMVDGGWISTIHTMCSKVLRRNAFEAGIDPGFAVADQRLAKKLLEEALLSAASELISECCETRRLLGEYGWGPTEKMVLDIVGDARQLGIRPREVVVAQPPPWRPDTWASELVRVAEETRALAGQTKTTAANQASARALAAAIPSLEPDSEEALGALDRVRSENPFACRGSEEVKALASAAKAVIAEVEASLLGVYVRRFEEALIGLAEKTADIYAAKKRARGLLDFDDLQILVARLLEGPPGKDHGPGAWAFEALMIDEYQDTDPLQDAIATALCDGAVCTVGDEHQSIYGFRNADVGIFRERRRRVADEDKIELDVNYRSHEEVVAFVNAVFRHETLFGSEFLALRCGREAPEAADREGADRVRIAMIEGATSARDGRKAEARWIAGRIREMLDRGIPPGDIAILMRRATVVEDYSLALREAGIPVLLECGATPLERPAVRQLTVLLRLVANSLSDSDAAVFLLSPSIGMTPNGALAAAKAAKESESSLLSALASKLEAGWPGQDGKAAERALQIFGRLRRLAATAPMGVLVHEAANLISCGFGAAEGGASRELAEADACKFARIANEFDRDEAGGLDAFLAHLEDRKRMGVERSSGPGTGGADAVRIMTVHAAKGLEFPVVFVPDLTRAQRGRADRLLTALVGGELHVALRAPSSRAGGGAESGKTPAYRELECARSQLEHEEAKRVLYVACTRAEERLFVSGAVKGQAGIGDVPLGWLANAADASGIGCVERLDASGIRSPEPPEDPPTAPPTAAEIPTAVRGTSGAVAHKLRTISYSALERGGRCAYSFYVTRLVGLAASSEGATSDKAAAFGNAAHEAMELDCADDPEALARIARRHDLGREESEQLVVAVASLARSEAATEANRLGSLREVAFSVDLGETTLVGVLDAMAKDGSRTLVIDYKTGRGPEDAQDARKRHALQADCYALAALSAGAEVAEVAFVYTADGEPKEIRFGYRREDLEALRRRLSSAYEALIAGPFEPLSRFDPCVCPGCPALGGVCPVQERGRRR